MAKYADFEKLRPFMSNDEAQFVLTHMTGKPDETKFPCIESFGMETHVRARFTIGVTDNKPVSIFLDVPYDKFIALPTYESKREDALK